jgi:hypothetical protein
MDMNKFLLLGWLLFFVLGAISYGCLILYVKKNHSSLYKEWGQPSVFTSSAKQTVMIQSFVFRGAFGSTVSDKTLTRLLQIVAVTEVIYIALFVSAIFDVL